MSPKSVVIGGLLGLLLISGCSERNPEAPPPGKTHPLNWVLSHGVEAQAHLDNCRTCHGFELRGQGGAPGCFECHFGPDGARIPAGSTVVHGTIAHASLLDDGAVCNRCHQVLRQAGKGPDNCHDCHVGASHPLGQNWLDRKSPTFHGLAAQQNLTECRSCHGSDLLGGPSGVACNSCHFGADGSRVPTGSTWNHGTVPHGELAPNVAICNGCHTLDRMFGNGPAACHDCHVGASHPLGQAWLDKKVVDYHGAVVLQSGTASCLSCHGSDLTGGVSGVGCSTCHFTPEGSKVPVGTGWAHGSIPHGDLNAYDGICETCHTQNRLYGNGPAPCHDCHLAATHALGQPWVDKKQAGFHGSIVSQQGSMFCQPCHGADLLGGSSGVSCSSCHFGPNGSKVPVGADWQHGTIPHVAYADQVAVCDACHERNRLYGNGPATCHDCHANPPHPLGKAWLDSAVAGYHGSAAPQNITLCQGCHGSDLQGGSSGVGCGSCHFGPDGSRVPAGTAWIHGTVPHDQLTAGIAVCNGCHQLDREYGHGPAPCHDCHVSVTHAIGQPWIDPKSPVFHGPVAQQNPDSCKPCHGGDFTGGPSGISCFNCHFGPTGTRVPAGSDWLHGSIPHGQLAASILVCNTCHDNNRLYGNPPSPCHDCHVGADHPLGQAWVDYKSSTFHGTAAIQDSDSCKPCHGNDFTGGVSGVSCFLCHFGPTGTRVPPGETWNHGSIPHGTLLPYLAVCNTCHDSNRMYGNGPGSCHDCHQTATHPLGQAWLDKKNAGYHGAAAKTNLDLCRGCHGSDLLGGGSGVSCQRCHFDALGNRVPAGAIWSHGLINHGDQVAQQATCTECHNTNRLYSNPPASCHDCHLAADHPLGQAWLDNKNAGYHGAAALAAIDSCKQCHGTDYQGGASGVSCYSCHFGPTGTRVPPGSGWTHGLSAHGDQLAQQAICSQCHNTNRLYSNPPAACHDCHFTADHPLGQAWLDKKNAGYHGAAALAAIDSCKQCHGFDYLGGASGVSCNSCHFGPTGTRIPPGSGWTHGLNLHGDQLAQQAICSQCHNTNRLYSNPPTACHDCHLAADHPLGQGWLDKKNAGYHGVAALVAIDSCKQCHGVDYQGGASGVSCYSCHFGPTGTRIPPGSGWTHGLNLHGDQLAQQAICSQCHNTNRLYSNPPTVCHDCHFTADHPLGQGWLDKKNAGYHGVAALAAIDSCKQCHGVDYQGGASGVSCYSCHFGPTGTRIPPGSGWTHGLNLHGDQLAQQAICSQCHNTNRLYSNPPTVCHDCHFTADHPLGQAWLDKKNAGYHGAVALVAIDSCKQCHGVDYQGGGSGVSCYSCHFGPTGTRIPPGSGWSHGLTAHGGQVAQLTVCNQCHTTNRLYSNPPASCHDCHLTANHPLGQQWLDSSVAGYHGSVAQSAIDSCKQCHGADYTGGGGGVSCYGCHFGPTGSKVPLGVTWTHGSSHTTLATYEAVCSQCHTLTRSFGRGPASCHDCHGTHTTGAAWLLPSAHVAQSITDRATCLGCHSMATGGSGSAPACRGCHTLADPPLATGQCTSCHGRPPNGTAFPNRNRRHNTHSGASCNTCHSGFGTGSLNHWYPNPAQPADVAFTLSAPDTMSYNGSTCTGSCHISGGAVNHNYSW